MVKRKLWLITAITCMTLVVALLPFLSACGESKEGKTLKVGITTPTTGPAAEKGAPMGHGNLDCIDYINDELGGVNGYEIEVVWLDNGYDAAKVVTIVERFMDEGCLLYTTHPRFFTARHSISTGRCLTMVMISWYSPNITWKISGKVPANPRWHCTC